MEKHAPELSCWRLFKATVLSFLFLSSIIWLVYALAGGHSSWKHTEFIRIQLGQFTRAVQVQPAETTSTSWPSTPQPDHNETTISHILFGIGASAEAWPSRRRYAELWWKPNITRGNVWFDKRPNSTWVVGQGPGYQVSEDASRFPYTCWYGKRAAVRLSRILVESVRLREEGVRWYVIGDDDTVFFTENLVSVLGRYDHDEMYYIGGVSESVEQDVIHSYGMAFGGGGFAISAALAEELARIFDGCLQRYTSFYGSDQRIGACVNELGVPLTREHGFHQMDVRGEAYGLLAAHPVAPLVTLHHFDSLKPIFPFAPTPLDGLERLVRASRADPGRTLQQTIGYTRKEKWSISVSWGYTAQLYPSILTPKELTTVLQTFASWRTWSPGPFTFDIRPWENDECQQPLLYFFDKVEVLKDRTITTYERYHDRGRAHCGMAKYEDAQKVESIKVLAPKMELGEWKKAPRRYCSEVDGRVTDGSITMKVRKCESGETLSP